MSDTGKVAKHVKNELSRNKPLPPALAAGVAGAGSLAALVLAALLWWPLALLVMAGGAFAVWAMASPRLAAWLGGSALAFLVLDGFLLWPLAFVLVVAGGWAVARAGKG